VDAFVDRHTELDELNRLLRQEQAQFLAVYGRRRVGKTRLLLHWAERSGCPYLYWVARRETPDACRQSLAGALYAWLYPDLENPEPPRFASWEPLLREVAARLGERTAGGPVILIFDEFPYAVESDPTLPSHLQAAWDHFFKNHRITLALSGSHIGMMVDLMEYDAPLHGRFTAPFPVDPLPFSALKAFFPGYTAAERVATYATLGGIPAYLERFAPGLSLDDNIRGHLLRRTGMFRSEPSVLISDLVRETRIYEAILRTVAGGAHTPAEIASQTGLLPNNLPPYLKRLQELRLIERRVPATIPLDQAQSTTRSRYRLRDAYLRFYFRFIEPHQPIIELGNVETLWRRIAGQFNAFVGATAFEDLCREWLLGRSQTGDLPFEPEVVGSHWSANEQVDVVAVNWRQRAILLGECKWNQEPLPRNVLTGLVEKTPAVLPGPDWKVYYALFSRSGFAPAARQAAEDYGALLVDLAQLDDGLAGEGKD
jgi:hypothetical protein